MWPYQLDTLDNSFSEVFEHLYTRLNIEIFLGVVEGKGDSTKNILSLP